MHSNICKIKCNCFRFALQWYDNLVKCSMECFNVTNVYLQFNKQIKKAEGYKPQKVELVISIDTISVVEPKLKVLDL